MGQPHIIITTIWPMPHTGGVCTHVQLLREELMVRGFGVSLATPAEAEVYFDALPTGRDGVPESLMRMGMSLGRYLHLIADSNDALIHAHDPVACFAATEVGVGSPLALTVHGYLADEHVASGAILPGSDEYRELLEIERISYGRANSLIAVDARIAEHIERMSGRRADVIPNAVSTQRFDGLDRTTARLELNLPVERPVLLCPRRLTEKNGVRFAIEALGCLPPHTRALLVIAGDGEQRDSLIELARSIGVEDSCLFVGAVPHDRIPLYYAASDIVLIPSVHASGVEEATSISALEGMAACRPVIASKIGGLAEIFRSGDSGVLVPPAEPEALAHAIEALLADDSCRISIGLAARAKVSEAFGPKRFGSSVLQAYDRAVQTCGVSASLSAHGHVLMNRPRTFLPRPTRAIDEALGGWPEVPDPIGAIRRAGLSVAFVAPDNHLSEISRVFFEWANQLHCFAIATAVISLEPKPDWIRIDVPWIQVGTESELYGLEGLFELVIGMVWTDIPRLLRMRARTKVHLEQGFLSMSGFEGLPEQTQRFLSTCFEAPVGIMTVSEGLSSILAERFGRRAVVLSDRAANALVEALLEFVQPDIEKDRETAVGQKIELFHLEAINRFNVGNLLGAREFLRTVLSLDPRNLDSLYNLAYVHAALNENELAAGLVNRILEVDPSQEDAVNLRAFLLEKAAPL